MAESVTLVLPPLVPELFDTIYPSLPVLAGCLAEAGHEVTQLDLNRAYVCDRLAAKAVAAAYEGAAGRLRELDARPSLDGAAAGDYHGAHLTLLAAAFVRRHRKRLTAGGGALTFQLDGRHDVTAFLARLLPAEPAEGVSEELAAFLAEQAGAIGALRPRVVAVSVPMGPQLAPAVALALLLRERAPKIFVCLGGPVLSLLDDEALAEVLAESGAGAVLRFEGEEALPALVAAVAGNDALAEVPNIVLPGQAVPPRDTTARLRSLDALPFPRYDDDAVAANEHVALAAVVARGCYWGRCAYCDYTALYGPGAFRQKRAARAADEVAHLAQHHGRRSFQLVAESLAPPFARRFSSELLARGLDLSWAAYLRVDDRLDAETAARMAEAGCRQATVGVESTCDRVLDHVRKGTTRAATEVFVDRLLDAGIAVWVNLIPDLPSTTAEEALRSLEVIEARSDRLAGVSVFPFALTRSSPMGRDPATFGLELTAGDEASSYKGLKRNDLAFRDQAGMSPDEKAEVFGRYRALSAALRTRASRERTQELLAEPNAARWTFRHAAVLITPCRFVVDPAAPRERYEPTPALVLYDVPRARMLALPERLSPLLVTATSLKRFRLGDLVQAGVDAWNGSADQALDAAEPFLRSLITAGMVDRAGGR